MAYNPLPAKSPPAYLNQTDYDAIKGNFEAGVPDLFTTKGDIVVATGADAGARLGVGPNDSRPLADSTQATGWAWQIQPAVSAYNSGNIALSAGAWTALTFNSERFDTDAMHSTASNTGRLTVPSGGAGKYLIGCNVEFDSSAIAVGCFVNVRFLLNGTTVIAKKTLAIPTNDVNYDAALDLTVLYQLAVADYVEVQVYPSQAITVQNAGSYSPEFWAIWQRR